MFRKLVRLSSVFLLLFDGLMSVMMLCWLIEIVVLCIVMMWFVFLYMWVMLCSLSMELSGVVVM